VEKLPSLQVVCAVAPGLSSASLLKQMQIRYSSFFQACGMSSGALIFLLACSSDEPGGAMTGSGGDVSTGGVPTGGAGPAVGGQGESGGAPSGGATSGGAASGGAASGGTTAGGTSAGGGESTGGVGVGGAGDGGSKATLFADDFEAASAGDVVTGASWSTTLPTEYDSGGIVAVLDDAAGAHSGSKYVHVLKGTDGQGFLQLIDPAVFPFSASKIFVRTWMKVPSWPDNHASWIEIGSSVNEQSEMRIGAHQSALQVNHWPGDQDQIAPSATMSENTWHCIEFSYEPSTKTLEVWLDDVAVPDLTVMGSFERGGAFDPAPPIEAIRFGAEISAATEAWYDDVVVDTSPIGCN
jgi:hypothetical protein